MSQAHAIRDGLHQTYFSRLREPCNNSHATQSGEALQWCPFGPMALIRDTLKLLITPVHMFTYVRGVQLIIDDFDRSKEELSIVWMKTTILNTEARTRLQMGLLKMDDQALTLLLFRLLIYVSKLISQPS